MKWILWTVAALIAVVGLVAVIGFFLPVGHEASRSAEFNRPPEIVFATSTDRNAPTRLRAADIATAILGESAPVEMVVAMAFAVSWKPFVKSNTKAVMITIPMRSVMCSIHPGNQFVGHWQRDRKENG